MTRKWIVLAVASMVFVLMIPAGFMVFAIGGCGLGWPDGGFESDEWRAADPFASCSARYRMKDELLAKELVVGRTRSEVIAMLGEPSADEDGERADDSLEYIIGCWIDCDHLIVEFDAGDHLVRAYVYQD